MSEQLGDSNNVSDRYPRLTLLLPNGFRLPKPPSWCIIGNTARRRMHFKPLQLPRFLLLQLNMAKSRRPRWPLSLTFIQDVIVKLLLVGLIWQNSNTHTHTHYEDLYYQLTAAAGRFAWAHREYEGRGGGPRSIDLKQAPMSGKEKYSQEQNLHVKWEGSVRWWKIRFDWVPHTGLVAVNFGDFVKQVFQYVGKGAKCCLLALHKVGNSRIGIIIT